MTIILSTLNARYAHASLGLRYLLANMGELQGQTRLQEFVIGSKTTDIVEKLLQQQPRIIGFGVYIWNVEETTRVVAMLKQVAPQIVIVLGGPEVSHESQQQAIVQAADYLITGWGDVSFPKLCREILSGPKPLMKIHAGVQPPLDDITLPYALYTERRPEAPHPVCGSVARLSVQVRVLPVGAGQDRLAVRPRRVFWPNWRRLHARGARCSSSSTAPST